MFESRGVWYLTEENACVGRGRRVSHMCVNMEHWQLSEPREEADFVSYKLSMLAAWWFALVLQKMSLVTVLVADIGFCNVNLWKLKGLHCKTNVNHQAATMLILQNQCQPQNGQHVDYDK